MSCSTSVKATGQLHLGQSRQDKPAYDPRKMQILMVQTACERLSRCVSIHPSLIPKRFAHKMDIPSLCQITVQSTGGCDAKVAACGPSSSTLSIPPLFTQMSGVWC
jgi:hypothetical protein